MNCMYYTFMPKQKNILARLVTEEYKKIVDKNGETLTGLYGDIEIITSDNHHFFMDKWEFLDRYSPIDSASINEYINIRVTNKKIIS